jgi:hypothetical protein
VSGFINPFAPKPSISFSEAIGRIRQWTRQAGAAGPHDVISVNELACPEEGCPPRETVIIVMADGEPRKGVIHKAMKDVTETDVAVAFASPDADS